MNKIKAILYIACILLLLPKAVQAQGLPDCADDVAAPNTNWAAKCSIWQEWTTQQELDGLAAMVEEAAAHNPAANVVLVFWEDTNYEVFANDELIAVGCFSFACSPLATPQSCDNELPYQGQLKHHALALDTYEKFCGLGASLTVDDAVTIASIVGVIADDKGLGSQVTTTVFEDGSVTIHIEGVDMFSGCVVSRWGCGLAAHVGGYWMYTSPCYPEGSLWMDRDVCLLLVARAMESGYPMSGDDVLMIDDAAEYYQVATITLYEDGSLILENHRGVVWRHCFAAMGCTPDYEVYLPAIFKEH